MPFPTGLFEFLTPQSSITALLGTTASRTDKTTGVFPAFAPAETPTPYIVFTRIHQEPVQSLKGANKLQQARWRITAVGNAYEEAEPVAEALRVLFATYTGTFPDGTVVQSAALITCNDLFEEGGHGTLFTNHSDFEFWFIDDDGA